MAYSDILWQEAKKKCRLNNEDIKIAKELGLNPKSLIKNIPNMREQWKAPVSVWIREIQEERQNKSLQKQKRKEYRTPLMLVNDRSFIPVTLDGEDEYFPNGIFVFNITKMLRYIEANRDKIMCEDIDVIKYRDEKFNIDEGYLEFSDISKPVILAEISPGTYNLIDGHHRIEKAYRLGIKSVQAYILKPAQHMTFLTTEQAYLSYITYWNSKIEDGFIPAICEVRHD